MQWNTLSPQLELLSQNNFSPVTITSRLYTHLLSTPHHHIFFFSRTWPNPKPSINPKTYTGAVQIRTSRSLATFLAWNEFSPSSAVLPNGRAFVHVAPAGSAPLYRLLFSLRLSVSSKCVSVLCLVSCDGAVTGDTMLIEIIRGGEVRGEGSRYEECTESIFGCL